MITAVGRELLGIHLGHWHRRGPGAAVPSRRPRKPTRTVTYLSTVANLMNSSGASGRPKITRRRTLEDAMRQAPGRDPRL